jgi:CHAD domain-containing protein
MAFELKNGERIPKGIRRIVCTRIDDALETIADTKRSATAAAKGTKATVATAATAVSDHAVHETRKRFKEIRGTLRLVRDELGEKNFRRENVTFRDAGRPLSALRDAKVLVDTLDELIRHFHGRVKARSFSKLRRALLDRQRAVRKQVLEQDHTVAGIVRRVRAARKRVGDWPLHKGGWRAIAGGLRQVYRQARRAMQTALAELSDEALHEWRKRTKDLRYELELLQCVWPETIEPLADQAHHLTDLLGEDHDLSVLKTVAREEAENTKPTDNELLIALLDERRQAIQTEASELGQKLFEERPSEFIRRLHGYWKTSKKAAS